VSGKRSRFDFTRRVPGRGAIPVIWWDFCAFLCWSWLKLSYGLRRIHRDRVPATGAILVISNHQSFLDPMVNGVTVWDRQFTALARDSSGRSAGCSARSPRGRSSARAATSRR